MQPPPPRPRSSWPQAPGEPPQTPYRPAAIGRSGEGRARRRRPAMRDEEEAGGGDRPYAVPGGRRGAGLVRGTRAGAGVGRDVEHRPDSLSLSLSRARPGGTCQRGAALPRPCPSFLLRARARKRTAGKGAAPADPALRRLLSQIRVSSSSPGRAHCHCARVSKGSERRGAPPLYLRAAAPSSALPHR